MEMELKLAEARRQRRTSPKSEALGPKSKALASKNQNSLGIRHKKIGDFN